MFGAFQCLGRSKHGAGTALDDAHDTVVHIPQGHSVARHGRIPLRALASPHERSHRQRVRHATVDAPRLVRTPRATHTTRQRAYTLLHLPKQPVPTI